MQLAAILLCLFAFANGQNICPFSMDIYPCQCAPGKDSKPWIKCKNISSVSKLVSLVRSMKTLSVSNFNLENSNIGALPADIFSNMEIQSLNIINTNLTKLSEGRNRPPFSGLEDSLEMLEIKNAFRAEKAPLTGLSLSHLKKLSSIHLDGNFIPTLGNDWFESGPYGVRDIHFYNVNTTKLGSHAFEAFENLRTFTFKGALITEITRDMLPQPAANVLEKIDLSMNKLKTLPNDMFENMPVLEEIYFENNQLTTINEVVFAPVWSKLVYANFNGNPIICDSNIKWIFKYRTPENFRGRCAGPTKLQNRDFSSLTLLDFE